MRVRVSDAEQTFDVKISVGITPQGEISPVLSEKRVQQRSEGIRDPRQRDDYIEIQTDYRESLTGIEEITTKFVSWGWYQRTQIQSSSIRENPFGGPFTSSRDVALYAREKFRKLFRGWDLDLDDDDGNLVELSFEPETGSLTEESMGYMERSPQLLRILDSIVAEADRVLEYGESPEGNDVLGGVPEKNLIDSSPPGSSPENPEEKA